MLKLKLKGKLLLSVCTILFTALSISIATISIKTYSLSKQEAMDKTAALADNYAAEIANQINKPLSGARTLANIFSGIKNLAETTPPR